LKSREIRAVKEADLDSSSAKRLSDEEGMKIVWMGYDDYQRHATLTGSGEQRPRSRTTV
jgi:hypothetical protein